MGRKLKKKLEMLFVRLFNKTAVDTEWVISKENLWLAYSPGISVLIKEKAKELLTLCNKKLKKFKPGMGKCCLETKTQYLWSDTTWDGCVKSGKKTNIRGVKETVLWALIAWGVFYPKNMSTLDNKVYFELE